MERLIAIKKDDDSLPNHYRFLKTNAQKNDIENVIKLCITISNDLPVCPEDVLDYLTEDAISLVIQIVIGGSPMIKHEIDPEYLKYAELYNIHLLKPIEESQKFNQVYRQYNGKEVAKILLDCRIAEFEFVVDCYQYLNLSKEHPSYLEMLKYRHQLFH